MADIRLDNIAFYNLNEPERQPNVYATFFVPGLGEIKIQNFGLSKELLTAIEKEARVVLDKKLGRTIGS